jgi:hypothetical protein
MESAARQLVIEGVPCIERGDAVEMSYDTLTYKIQRDLQVTGQDVSAGFDRAILQYLTTYFGPVSADNELPFTLVLVTDEKCPFAPWMPGFQLLQEQWLRNAKQSGMYDWHEAPKVIFRNRAGNQLPYGLGKDNVEWWNNYGRLVGALGLGDTLR